MLTVIFTSFNGELTVGRMLAALCDLAPPDGGWKLVAADNCSTDRTGEIMRSFQGRLPITVISVNARGKNRALNQAINHVGGDLVVFTDDDVIPDRQWLRKLEECAREHPAHQMFSGPILPHWPREPDRWILESVYLEMAFALSDPALKDGEIPPESVWGPNMVIRRTLFAQGLRFSTNIGPDGTNAYMMGSETEFTRRVAKTGAKAWFCASATVQHMIRENQLSEDWILQRYFRHGRSAYFFADRGPPDVPTILGVERWLYGQLLSSRVRAMGQLLFGNRKARFVAMAGYHFAKGRIHQSRLMHESRKGNAGAEG